MTRQDPSRPGVLERIDSVAVVGDSVRISSTFGMPSLAGGVSDSAGKVGGVVLGGAAKVMMGAMRFVQQQELDRLKLRLEQP